MLIHRYRGQALPGLHAAPDDLLADAFVWYGPQFLRLSGATTRIGSNSLGAQRPGKPGLGMSWTRSANAGVDFGVFQPIPGLDATVLVLASPVAGANRKIAFSQRTSGSNAAQWMLGLNTDGSLGATSGSVSLVCRSTGAVLGASSAGSQIDGAPHCWVVGRGGAVGSGYVYRDGEAQTLASNTPGTGTVFVSTQVTKIGNIGDYATDGTFVCDDPIFAVVVWPRVIDQEIAQRLSKAILHEPALLLRPRSFAMPSSAAAGGGATDLAVNETAHAHSADALTLTTSAVLTISDSTHAHAAESPAPSSSLGLTIAEALHGHAADSLTLSVTGSESLVTADATHGHAADSLALSSDTGLTVADALHAHAADNLTLDTTGAATLTTQDATHAHAVDAPMLYTDWLLAVAEATHGHAADNVSLSDAPELAPQDATHGHTADVLALSADTWLTIQQATQAQAADNVTLGGVAPEPWPLLATRGVSAHGHGSARPEQRSTATRRNVQ